MRKSVQTFLLYNLSLGLSLFAMLVGVVPLLVLYGGGFVRRKRAPYNSTSVNSSSTPSSRETRGRTDFRPAYKCLCLPLGGGRGEMVPPVSNS